MVIEVLVAQRQRIDPLPQQLLQGVFDQIGIAMVGETPGKAPQIPFPLVQAGQQHAAAITGNVSGLEIHHHGTRG